MVTEGREASELSENDSSKYVGLNFGNRFGGIVIFDDINEKKPDLNRKTISECAQRGDQFAFPPLLVLSMNVVYCSLGREPEFIADSISLKMDESTKETIASNITNKAAGPSNEQDFFIKFVVLVKKYPRKSHESQSGSKGIAIVAPRDHVGEGTAKDDVVTADESKVPECIHPEPKMMEVRRVVVRHQILKDNSSPLEKFRTHLRETLNLPHSKRFVCYASITMNEGPAINKNKVYEWMLDHALSDIDYDSIRLVPSMYKQPWRTAVVFVETSSKKKYTERQLL